MPMPASGRLAEGDIDQPLTGPLMASIFPSIIFHATACALDIQEAREKGHNRLTWPLQKRAAYGVRCRGSRSRQIAG